MATEGQSPELKAKQVRGALAAILVGLFLLLPVLYVLSFGPAVWLAERGYLSGKPDSPAGMFYSPITSACKESPACLRAIKWYVSWFVSKN